MRAGQRDQGRAPSTTRALLHSAVIGAASAIVIVLLGPVLLTAALASPVVYSLLGSVHILGPLIAGRWVRRPGSVLLTAFVAALLAVPFTSLGLLTIPALCLPAAAIEAVLALGGFWRTGRPLVWFAAAGVGGLVIFAISLTVIDPRVLSGGVVALTLAGRVGAYLAMAAVAVLAERALTRAGVARLRPAGTPRAASAPKASQHDRGSAG